jgi:hypothetical protein
MGQYDSGDDFVRRSLRACPNDLMRQIVADNRGDFPRSGSMIPNKPSAGKVIPEGAGRVVGGPDVPVASTGTGWAESPQVNDWKPPGLSIMDRMMDQQDAIDRAARLRELAEATAVQRAEAEIKQREEEEAKKQKGPKT